MERSPSCRRCHEEAYASWARSYHRSMTQPVGAAGTRILAPFAGEHLDYLGYRATMDRTEAGRPRVTIRRLDAAGEPVGAPVLQAEVTLAVGSHRYQQYVARMDRGGGPEEAWRLPVAWHPGLGRWLHMNAAFLEPEGTVGADEDYFRHLNRYNDNCLFCHNTEPRPGRTAGGTFRTRVGEWGVACEACHGPGDVHVERNRDPFVRIAAGTVRARGDASIAHPGRLDRGRSSQICGRCHGQRIAPRIEQVLRDGDGFRPGTDLARVSRPIFRATRLAGTDGAPFESRFWSDGTPRLSAYEYQGLLLSPCEQDGTGLGCNDCHDMHGDDPAGQVRAGWDGDGACARCHDPATLSRADAGPVARHGGHDEAVTCLDCHMPRTTYGLLSALPSHRITSPDPGAATDRPSACALCHADRTRAWLAGRRDEAKAAVPELVRLLYGGDPIQRALAVEALAWRRSAAPATWRARALLAAFDDPYPAIRVMAGRDLAALAEGEGWGDVAGLVADWDPLAPPEERAAAEVALVRRLGPTPLAADPERADALRANASTRAIWIGE